MRAKLKAAIRVVAFLCCLALSVYAVDRTLCFKQSDGPHIVHKFYQQDKNTIDVLFLGSSHMYTSSNPVLLWQEAGIPAYNLCGSMQPLWNTYHYLIEALKYQRPKLVVLDVFCAHFEVPTNYESVIKNTSGLRFGKNKYEVLQLGTTQAEHPMDIFLGLPSYHTRYKSLNRKDFEWLTGGPPYPNGYLPAVDHRVVEPPAPAVDARRPLEERGALSAEYFYKILDLCAAEGLELLLVATPQRMTESRQTSYNTIADIAAQRGLRFLNYNLDYAQAGFDYALDMSDNEHPSTLGADKLTRHLAGYMRQHYDLPDRRGQQPWAGWDAWAAACEPGIQTAREESLAALQRATAAEKTDG